MLRPEEGADTGLHAGRDSLPAAGLSTALCRNVSACHKVHKLMHEIKTGHRAGSTGSCTSSVPETRTAKGAGARPHPMSHCQQLLWSLVTHIRDRHDVLWRILFPVSILIFVIF